jgi:hypothetical protein
MNFSFLLEILMAEQAMKQHPSSEPWANLKKFLDPQIALTGERAPDEPLEAHLIARRTVAAIVARQAHEVIDAIDQNPAKEFQRDA